MKIKRERGKKKEYKQTGEQSNTLCPECILVGLLEETASENCRERKHIYIHKNKIKYIERIEYNCNDEN